MCSNSGDFKSLVFGPGFNFFLNRSNHTVQGISINSDHVYLLLEFCAYGSINKFLQLKEVEFRIKLQKKSNRELICWSSQVADAMGFLAKNDIIHVRNFPCIRNFLLN